MGWFKRLQDGIKTATVNKKEAPEGAPVRVTDGVVYSYRTADFSLNLNAHRPRTVGIKSMELNAASSERFFVPRNFGQWKSNGMRIDSIRVDFDHP